jgi:1-acyl-sn-glycerol-3-phosphate acyltransferase
MTFTGRISETILKLMGWKVKGEKPDLKKYVFLAAPHTSNWDFPLGRLSNSKLDIDLKVLMKKSWFFFPMGLIMRSLGAIPIDRSKSGTVMDYIIELFNKNDEFVFAITPEGTRSYVEYWKTGFYYIALKANVPIVCGYLDFDKKETGVGPVIYPTGNVEEDFEKIMSFYRTITAKHPEKFNQFPHFGKPK